MPRNIVALKIAGDENVRFQVRFLRQSPPEIALILRHF
jgi:hypothetical protein